MKHAAKIVFLLVVSTMVRHTEGERPYLTTRSPLTLFSTNDGETDIFWRETVEGLIDTDVKTQDSFTVIRLGPNHPPISKTVSGSVPSTLIGTPSMAMSSDGRYALVTNHGLRLPFGPIAKNPPDQPLAMKDVMSMIDLGSQEFDVVHRVSFDDHPLHVQPHPDGRHFIVGGSKYFYVFEITNGKLREVSRTAQPFGVACFWIHPEGTHLIATQGDPLDVDTPASLQWYSIDDNDNKLKIKHHSTIRTKPGVHVLALDTSHITRIRPDGKMALVCQRAVGSQGSLCDVFVVDLTSDPPQISGTIEQVGDGVESFAFHPNNKMAVVTCLSLHHNSIAVLDVEHAAPRVLYYLDVGGVAQGVEFTPEGDRLFVGSAFANRIEVFDVVGEFDLRKNPKHMKTGHGHGSLTLGPTYRP